MPWNLYSAQLASFDHRDSIASVDRRFCGANRSRNCSPKFNSLLRIERTRQQKVYSLDLPTTGSIFMSQASNGNRLTLPVGARDHSQGPIDATVTLVKYGGYQCPHSGEAHGIVKKLQQRLGDQLCFVFRHFPLTEIHAQALKAAQVAEYAAAQGRFWQMHDILFERQQALDNGHLVEYAIELGLDIPQFLSALAGRIYAERIYEDFESGISSRVSNTPTFFINSVRHTGAWDLESLLMEIKQAGAT